MRKLFSFLLVLEMSGISASSVVACNTNNRNKPNVANNIKNKIQNTNVVVEEKSGASLNSGDYKQDIDTALLAENKATNLTKNDLANVTYSGFLKNDQPVKVEAHIKVGANSATIPLQVTLGQNNNKIVAQAIIEKIDDNNLVVSQTTNPDITSEQTQNVFKNALRDANTTLTNDDLAKMQYRGSNLKKGVQSSLDLNVTVGNYTSNKTINALIANSDIQQAQAIRDKITTTTGLEVDPNTNPNAIDQDTEIKINVALRGVNPFGGLTNSDLSKITYQGTLAKGRTVPLTGTITFGTASITFAVQVSLAQTNAEIAEAIKQKINQPNLVLPTFTTGNIGSNQGLLIDTLLEENPALADDAGRLAFLNLTTNILSGQNNNVVLAIRVGDQTVTTNLNVTLNNIFTKTSLQNSWNAVSPVKIGNRIYSATQNGLFYSINNGETWNKIAGIPESSQNGQIIEFLNDKYYVSVISSNGTQGLYSSSDGLTNWTRNTFNYGTQSTQFAEIQTKPIFYNNRYYVAKIPAAGGVVSASSGLYTSTDGVNWNIVQNGLATGLAPSATPTQINNTLYLPTSNMGLWSSNDNGQTWTQNNSLPTNASVLGVPQVINKVWYLRTTDGLYVSNDQGKTWEGIVIAGLNNSQIKKPIIYNPTTKKYWAVSETSGGTVKSGLWESSDGQSWTNIIRNNANLSGKLLQPPVLINGLYYLPTDFGLYNSQDGVTWTLNPTPTPAGDQYGFADEFFGSEPLVFNNKIFLQGYDLWTLS